MTHARFQVEYGRYATRIINTSKTYPQTGRPGALLTYLLMGDVGPNVLGLATYQNLTGAEAWAAFLVTSYLSGHLLFLTGSWLDVFPYDWLKRRYSLKQQIIRLGRRGTLLPWFARALICTVFKQERDLALDCVDKIKAQALKGLGAQDAVNIFQWSTPRDWR